MASDLPAEIHGIPVHFRRSTRARHLKIVEAPLQFEVVMPRRVTVAQVKAFVSQNVSWMGRYASRIEARRKASQEPSILIRGNAVAIVCGENSNWRGEVRSAAEGAIGLIRVPALTIEEAKGLMAAELRKLARPILLARVSNRAAQMGLSPGKVFIRDQKTKWGVCSSRANVGFNWRLVMAPPFVQDYIVVHELAHLAELNHSPRFWSIVEKHFPDRPSAEQWLKLHQHELMQLGS